MEEKRRGYARPTIHVTDEAWMALGLAREAEAAQERTKLSRGVRAYVLHPHLLFYRIDPTARLLTVVRVIHGHRDLTADEFED